MSGHFALESSVVAQKKAAIFIGANDTRRADLVRTVKGLVLTKLYEPTPSSLSSVTAQLVLDAHAGKFDLLAVASIADLSAKPINAVCIAAKLRSIVEVVSLSEDWLQSSGSALGSIAQWLQQQETARRSKTAKESGALRRGGRPRKNFSVLAALDLLAQPQMTVSRAAMKLGVGSSTLRRELARHREKIGTLSVSPSAMNIETAVAGFAEIHAQGVAR